MKTEYEEKIENIISTCLVDKKILKLEELEGEHLGVVWDIGKLVTKIATLIQESNEEAVRGFVVGRNHQVHKVSTNLTDKEQ